MTSRYVIIRAITVPQSTLSAATAGEPGSGGAAGYGGVSTSSGYAAFPQSFLAGTPIVLDSASPLYTYLNGQGALRAWVQGQDDARHAALANLPGGFPPGARASIVQGSALTGSFRPA